MAESNADDTMPIPFLPPLPENNRIFAPYSLDELDDAEIKQVRLQITAYVYAQKFLHPEVIIPKPNEYRERYYVWKMILQQIAAGSIAMAVFTSIILATSLSTRSGELDAVFGVGTIVLVIVYSWFVYRIYFDWRHTFIESNLSSTGIIRAKNKWLLLIRDRPRLTTSKIDTLNESKGYFTEVFSINSWRVSISAPGQDGKALKNMRFVKDGDRLTNTISKSQEYLLLDQGK